MTDWESGSDTNKITKTNIVIDAYSSKVFRFFGDNVTVTVTDKDGKNVETKIPQ